MSVSSFRSFRNAVAKRVTEAQIKPRGFSDLLQVLKKKTHPEMNRRSNDGVIKYSSIKSERSVVRFHFISRNVYDANTVEYENILQERLGCAERRGHGVHAWRGRGRHPSPCPAEIRFKTQSRDFSLNFDVNGERDVRG